MNRTMNKDSLKKIASEVLDDRDYHKDSTAQSVERLEKIIGSINTDEVNRVLDIGCGRGGITEVFATYFDSEAIGIDINSDLFKEDRDITYMKIDANGSLPFEDNSFDFISCLGLIEHIEFYDNLIEEIKRILSDKGFCLFIFPNLAGWTNRLSILGGWQPRNVEFSKKKPFGTAPWYKDDDLFLNHTKSPTYRAFYEMVEYYGFDIVETEPFMPYQKNIGVKAIDWLTNYSKSLSRRIGFLIRKPNN